MLAYIRFQCFIFTVRYIGEHIIFSVPDRSFLCYMALFPPAATPRRIFLGRILRHLRFSSSLMRPARAHSAIRMAPQGSGLGPPASRTPTWTRLVNGNAQTAQGTLTPPWPGGAGSISPQPRRTRWAVLSLAAFVRSWRSCRRAAPGWRRDGRDTRILLVDTRVVPRTNIE